MLFNRKFVSISVIDSDSHERNKELSFLREMGNFLSLSLDLQALLTGALSKVLEYFDVDAGRIYLANEKGSAFYLAAHLGMKPEGLEKLSFDDGFSGKAARTKSFIAQHVSELEDKKRAHLLMSKGFKIVICVPLIVKDTVLGVMNLSSKRIIRLDHNKIDLCIAVGNQIAIAANNALIYRDLQNNIKALNEKKDTIKFFAYSISHDLKSPAIGVYGLVKRLKEKYGDYFDETGKAYCDQILRATQHILDLVEKINAYIVTKESPLNIEVVKVKDITESIITEFSDKLRENNIKWSEPASLPKILVDRVSLLRVFRNLVDNSLKYGGKHLREIKIGYKESRGHHIFSFSDDGVGIKGKDREGLFEAFHRNESSKEISGAGLGLAIVKEVAERHRGRVWLDENLEKGATFYISISKLLGFPD